jgi:hypothetical protein
MENEILRTKGKVLKVYIYISIVKRKKLVRHPENDIYIYR